MPLQSKLRLSIGASAAILAFAAQAAYAQQTPAPADKQQTSPQDGEGPAPRPAVPDDQPGSDIVVTGTFIRGIAPTGTNVISLDRDAIVATGATSANDILTRTPQVSSAFLSTPTTSIGDGGLSVVRPNLRDLGGSGTSTTLVLLDGHRMVGAGGVQTSPDPDVIPPGVLERVEIVPDGGSSIYGSDAIGGVINFITRKKFDGFEVAGRYGFADRYNSYDLNVTAGKDWGSGSGYLSYAWAHNDPIYGRSSRVLTQVSPNAGFCAPGTVVANGTTYALPNRTPGTMTTCDGTDNQSFWPEVTRNTIFAGLNQRLAPGVTFDVRAFYSQRRLDHYLDFVSTAPQTLTVTSANPYFSTIAGETTQNVLTTFAGALDNRLRNRLTEFGITPSITASLGGTWQLRVLGNYGESTTAVGAVTTDATALAAALAGTTTATALNPYNPAGSDPAVLARIARFDAQPIKQYLYNARAIVDGSLFKLPGGDVRVAVGGEYTFEKRRAINSQTGLAVLQPDTVQSHNIKALFGELVVPVFGASNAVPGISALSLSVSGRFDSYSDVGDTFNPKFGLTYAPVDWIKLRGNWGTSFNAPSVIDNASNNVAGVFPANIFVAGQQAPFSVIIAGNDGTNKPQTATTWSVGTDIKPPFAPGLTLSATYYNIEIKNILGLLLGTGIGFGPASAQYLRDNQSCAQVIAATAGIPQFQGLLPISAVCVGNPPVGPTFALLDFRLKNLGVLKQDGIDFNVAYNRKVGFGTINASVAGTYTLSRNRAIIPGTPFVDDLVSPGRSRFFFVASAGMSSGGFTGSAALNHRAGYTLSPAITTARFGTQNRVASFTTVDLYLSYSLPQSFLRDTAFTLNVSNLFDVDPPFYNGCAGTVQCGSTNGSTLGRLFTFGLRKKF